MSDDHGTVVTVDGRIDPEDLGVTVPHEHLFADWRDAKYTEPETAVERRLAEQPVTLENLAYVTKHYFSNADNLRLDSVEEAVRELERYVQAGGESFVDVTPNSLAFLTSVRTSALLRSALVGMHPRCRQVPPSLSFSTTATDIPS